MKKLGFGLMRLPKLPGGGEKDVDKTQTAEMIDCFLDRGFTYFDTAFVYHAGESEKIAGELLVSRYPRDKFQLTTKLPFSILKNKEDAENIFNTQLERTGAKYFDNYLIHGIGIGNPQKIDEFGVWDFMKSLKERELIRHLGFSFHSTPEFLEKLLQEHPEVEFVQLQINYADWESKDVQARRCYELAEKYGKRVFVMEPIRGGALTVMPPEVRQVFYDAAPDKNLASWALRFVAELPKVDVVLSGMSEMKHMLENTETFDKFEPLTVSEHAVIEKALDMLSKIPTIPCTACKYCEENCPEKIGVPRIFGVYNTYLTYKNLDGNRRRYGLLAGGRASQCIDCGTCEEHCPQNLPIRKLLKKVVEDFEN
jgi:predicted aldo/keto reductase-like oxidoreductase